VPVAAHNMIAGVVAAGLIVGAGYRLRALDRSGALAAWVLGAVVMGLGGWPFATPIVVFFLTSSALSFWRARAGGVKRGRDASQVIANGGAAALIAIAAAAWSPASQPTTRDWFLLYVAAIAFANADTWATEVGSKLDRGARLVTTWRSVAPGTSGGITLLGSGAAFAGAAVVVTASWIAWPNASDVFLWRPDAAECLAVIWAAFTAAFVDSLLGATVQGHFRCDACGAVTESLRHCDRLGERTRGISWIGNGTVNFAGSVAAAIFAWYLLRTFAWPVQ